MKPKPGTAEIVERLRELVATGMTVADAGRRMGIGAAIVNSIAYRCDIQAPEHVVRNAKGRRRQGAYGSTWGTRP